MTNDYKPGDRIRATIEAEVASVGLTGLWIEYDDETYPNWKGIRASVPCAAITEKIEPPAPAWIEGDIVYGTVTHRLFTRNAEAWVLDGMVNSMYTDGEISGMVELGKVMRAIVRGGEIVR